MMGAKNHCIATVFMQRFLYPGSTYSYIGYRSGILSPNLSEASAFIMPHFMLLKSLKYHTIYSYVVTYIHPSMQLLHTNIASYTPCIYIRIASY